MSLPQPLPNPQWQLFTPDEVAPIVRMSRATLYRRAAEGLPHHNIHGAGLMFTSADIDLILAQAERGRR